MNHAVVAEGLRFAYPSSIPGQATHWVIDGLDLQIASGEWLAVMGASDAGKTTLCLLLSGLAPHYTDGDMEGRITVAGRDSLESPPPALADTVGVLFQEAEAQLFNPTVEAEIAWGLENLGWPVAEIRGQVDEALSLLRLDRLRHRPPSQLSGGEKKRVALASILAMRPSVLVLDEPLGGLDPAGRRQVLEALSLLRRQEPPATIVMTESDPEPVAAFADRLVVLHQGRIALDGSPLSLFRQDAELAALGVAVPQLATLETELNDRLGLGLSFATIEEAATALAVHLA